MKKKTRPVSGSHQTAAVKDEIKNLASPAEVKAETAFKDIEAAALFGPSRLAQAYVINQKYGPLFTPAEALEKGTVFPALYSPYPY